MRKCATRATGQLLDALLDPAAHVAVRRRLPRVFKDCATQRAADGLRLALLDAAFEVRRESALMLGRLTAQNPRLELPQPAVFEAVLRELEAPAARDQLLEHVFTLLSLVLEREPLRLSLLALKGESPALRGTALEYLENVLPEPLRVALWPRLVTTERRALPPRETQQVVDELLKSRDLILRAELLAPKPSEPEPE